METKHFRFYGMIFTYLEICQAPICIVKRRHQKGYLLEYANHDFIFTLVPINSHH